MAKKKKDNKVLIFGVVAVLLFLLFTMKPGEQSETRTSEEGLSITFNVRSGSAQQAFINQEQVTDPQGSFDVIIDNTNPAGKINVSFVSKTDDLDGTLFENTAFPFTDVNDLTAGTSTPSVTTDWFSLNDYATSANQGTHYFTFNFEYDLLNATGGGEYGRGLTGTVEIDICSEACAGGAVAVGSCWDFELCENPLIAGTVCPELVPDQTCCEADGGTWSAGVCTPPPTGCTVELLTGGSVTIAFGDCLNNPVYGINPATDLVLPQKMLYCDEAQDTFIPNCNVCGCIDIYGMVPSCTAENKCNWDAYDNVDIRVGHVSPT